MVADRKRSPTELFDVNKKDDLENGYPTSIKSALYKSNGTNIGLSDARNFYKYFDKASFRMLVGVYKQLGKYKELFVVHEFIFSKTHRKLFLGKVSFEEIEQFHLGMGLTHFPKGEHENARIWSKSEKSKLMEKIGFLKLNPKIDSKTQRRLQCNLNLKDLTSNSSISHTKHKDQIHKTVLPIKIESSKRKFKK